MIPQALTHEETLSPHVFDIAGGLKALIKLQKYVEEKGMPEALDASNDNVRTYSMSLLEEVHELARELNWRPWHAHKTVDVDKALKEAADVLAFLGLMLHYLMELTGCTVEDIAGKYLTVSLDNITLLRTKRELPVEDHNVV